MSNSVHGLTEIVKICNSGVISVLAFLIVKKSDKCWFWQKDTSSTNSVPQKQVQNKYSLVNTNTRVIMEGLTIDESAKEDFKDMMGWDEITWKHNTTLIKNASQSQSELDSHTRKPLETSNPSVATSNVGVLDKVRESATNEDSIKKELDKDYEKEPTWEEIEANDIGK